MPKRRQPPAAAAAAAKRPRAVATAAVDDQPAAAAAAAVNLDPVLAPRMQAHECEICNEPLQISEAAGAGGAADALRSRLPRQLPCGHSWCTGCIQKQLDANGGSVGMQVGTNCDLVERRSGAVLPIVD